jgi:hypothetical protein
MSSDDATPPQFASPTEVEQQNKPAISLKKEEDAPDSSSEPEPERTHTFWELAWLKCCERRPGLGAMVGYSLSTFVGVALVVLCIPPLWRLGYGEIQSLCFGCLTPPVYHLSSNPWNVIMLASLYLNGLIAGLYGIYQGLLWAYTGSRQLRRQLIKQRRQQESS